MAKGAKLSENNWRTHTYTGYYMYLRSFRGLFSDILSRLFNFYKPLSIFAFIELFDENMRRHTMYVADLRNCHAIVPFKDSAVSWRR